jgi:hypothetical protein
MTTCVSIRVLARPFAPCLSRLCVVLLLFLSPLVSVCDAQSFAITGITRNGSGGFDLHYGSDTNSYYLLLEGPSISSITVPSRVALGIAGVAEFRSLPASAPSAFYRIRRIPLSQPFDTDGDGLDDVTELRSGILNPLDPTDRLTTILQSSPASGETDVAVTRETIFDFSMPLAESTVLTTNQVYATYGNRRLLSRVELSTDRRKATLFYLEPLPGSTRVSAVFDGTGLTDFLGRPVDADGDGQGGGVAVVRFDTLSLAAVPNTAVIGQVFASEPIQGSGTTNFINRPLAGVTITVDGREQELRTTTDAEGRFRLQPVPAGKFFVHVDGRTAHGSQWPSGNYYPVVGKAWEAAAGRQDNLAGGNGQIFLPLIIQGTLQPASLTTNTVVTFPASVVSNNPAMAGVSITVPANSLFSDNGTRGGRVGIAPVPADRLPEPLPPGLNLPIVITVQTDGASNFDRPVPVRFPNLPDPITGVRLPPGAKSALWSFNHDTGRWEIVGPMTVTDDGEFVETDPGVGIRQPGWHGSQPGVGGGGGGLGGGCGGGAGGGNQGENCRPNPDWNPNEHYNGCGPASESGWGDFLVPDNPNIIPCATFFDACKQHDIGYGTCGKPKSQTDFEFLQDLLAACDCLALFPTEYARCQALAVAYAAAVSAGGGGAYEAGQQLACICDPPPPPPGCEGSGSADGAHAVTTAQMVRALQTSPPPAQVGTVPPAGPLVSQAGTHHYAIYNLNTRQVVQRGRIDYSGSGGAFPQLILAPNTTYRIMVLQESTLFEGWAEITTGSSGTRLAFPTIFVRNPTSWDFDSDGLHDMGEVILGSNPQDTDTDNDGINDATEVRLGLNPLGAAPVATGVIASTDTPGTAVDVSALNDVVAVADSAAGVAIFDARGINPVIASQVDTPGTAQRVAWTGSMIAVADGTAGLAIIDATDASNARLVRQVPLGNATAVTAAAGLAYVGLQSGQIAVVEMTTGTVLRRVTIGAAVSDLAFGGDYLYALGDSTLFVLHGTAGDLAQVSAVPCPRFSTPNRRLAIGGGVAYTVHGKGFNTFDLSDPANPTLLLARNTSQFGWEHIVPNGSGLGIAAVGTAFAFDQQRVFSLYDLSDPAAPASFLTSYQHPGHARAVSVFNGLAYGAAHDAGLQVINYRAFDTLGQPPSVSLAADFPLDPPQAEEGKLVRLTADVTDDVQVRNVEFYINGTLAVVDGDFPFEYRFITPLRGPSVSSFTVRAVASDTGGNRAETPTITVQLVPDATPPRLVGQSPDRGQIVGSANTIAAFFNEPLDPATLSSAAFTLTFAGTDGVFGSVDDSLITGGVLEYRSAVNAVLLTFASRLAPGVYRAAVNPPLADLAGNVLPRSTSWEFLLLGAEDADLDGVPDNVENLLGLNPNNPDSDNDGILDGDEDPDSDGLRTSWELAYGYDPRTADTNGNGIADRDEDGDNDALINLREQLARTNPARADTDADNWPDESEVTAFSDPLDSTSRPAVHVVGAPRVSLVLPSAVPLNALARGVTVAAPPVSFVLPARSGLAFNVFVARPPVAAVLPAAVPLQGLAPGTTMAFPSVSVVLPARSISGGAPLGTFIGQPPIAVTLPAAVSAGLTPGVTIAPPPLSIVLPARDPSAGLAPGTTVGRPPVLIDFADQ